MYMIPIGDGDGDVNRFPDGDGDGDGDEAEKRGWGWLYVSEKAGARILLYLNGRLRILLVSSHGGRILRKQLISAFVSSQKLSPVVKIQVMMEFECIGCAVLSYITVFISFYDERYDLAMQSDAAVVLDHGTDVLVVKILN
ncbi:hypothetical protein Tco_1160522 [Tanacetum coccineum]